MLMGVRIGRREMAVGTGTLGKMGMVKWKAVGMRLPDRDAKGQAVRVESGTRRVLHGRSGWCRGRSGKGVLGFNCMCVLQQVGFLKLRA